MAKKVCWSTTICWGITLRQRGRDNFEVQYGAEVHKDLDYARAAEQLGQCIMHALACEDKLDNRRKGER